MLRDGDEPLPVQLEQRTDSDSTDTTPHRLQADAVQPPEKNNDGQDTELLAALRRGDPRAFASLISELHESMIRIASIEVGDDGAAEDVVQDTWLAVVSGLHRFQARSTLKTWILSILVRRARTVAARRRSSATLVAGAVSLGGLDGRVAGSSSPEAQCLQRESIECLQRALARLAPFQRRVFALRQVERRSPAEVAALLGITAAYQRVLLHRARQRLQAILAAGEATTR